MLPHPLPRNVLLVSRDRTQVDTLRDQLHAQGHVVEVAAGKASALALFFEAGGHEWVFLGSDLPEDEARALAASLREVEASVLVL